MAEFTYEVTERIAVLSTNARGWERQLNMVSWNGNPPKYDIRDWSPDGSRMAKGISLTEEELTSGIATFKDLSSPLDFLAFSKQSVSAQIYAPLPFLRPLASRKTPSSFLITRMSSFFAFISPQPTHCRNGIFLFAIIIPLHLSHFQCIQALILRMLSH